MKKLVLGLTATAVLTLGIFAFTGCEKEEVSQGTKKQTENPIKATANTDNPYSFIGELHNQGMDYVIQNANADMFDDTNNSIQEAKLLAIQYLTIIGCVQILDFLDSIGYPVNILEPNDLINSILNPTQVQLLTDLIYNVLNDISYNNLPQVQLYIDDFNESVSTISNENQRTTLYVASAVLLSSYTYWTQQFDMRNESPWFGDLYDNNGLCMAPLTQTQKENILKADVFSGIQGAAGGIIKGASIGSFVPGAGTISGTIAGLIAGGVGGAIAGSAITATYEKSKQIVQHVKKSN